MIWGGILCIFKDMCGSLSFGVVWYRQIIFLCHISIITWLRLVVKEPKIGQVM